MPRRVVTLPPTMLGDAAVAWAAGMRARGADLVELRTDLHGDLPLTRLAAAAPLLVSERGHPLRSAWCAAATLIDRELGSHSSGATLCSFHAEAPLSPEQAEARWAAEEVGAALVKHVEPLGSIGGAERLLDTRARLVRRYGPARVTVLATGLLALPSRARLARDNALDYLAVDDDHGFGAAPGQRLLADAVRADRAAVNAPRLGLLGTGLRRDPAPRLHPAPFDRIDVPADVDLASLLSSLLPHYHGLVIASPFERSVARLIGAELAAVDTLTRTRGHWVGHDSGAATGTARDPHTLVAQVCRRRSLWGI